MRKKTYEEIQEYFQENGCKLLSPEYQNNRTKMNFRCKCGVISKVTFQQFQKSPQCRNCGIQQMRKSKNKGQQKCRKCGADPKNYEMMDRRQHGNICRSCYNQAHVVYQKKHGQAYYLKHHEERLKYFASRREENPELMRKRVSQSYHKRRLETLKQYSPDLKCIKCGFDEHLSALSIDHINGNGNQHRKKVGCIYRWLKKNNYPEGYQVLCTNCQFIKRYENQECSGRPKSSP